MSSENGKYPQLIIHPNGTYNLYISEGVQVRFHHGDSIKDFIKNKNIQIIGGSDRRHPSKCLDFIIDF